MPRTRLLSTLAILVCVIAILHILATIFFLYWTFWWYDIILHFLGGIFVGLLVLWLRFFSGYFGTPALPSTTSVLSFVLVATLGIGIGWEAFERLLGHTFSVEGYWFDTNLDVILDFVGSLVAFWFFKSRYMRE
ncbi:MAG: hypothetical protein Q7R93_04560 [bacterium]|nr:hypothetical protein [bacterium]